MYVEREAQGHNNHHDPECPLKADNIENDKRREGMKDEKKRQQS
jgi:hypothetical protein